MRRSLTKIGATRVSRSAAGIIHGGTPLLMKNDAFFTSVSGRAKRFTRHVFLSAFVVTVLLFSVLFCLAVLLPSIEDPASLNSIRYKHRLLANAQSPKIVFVGGSNLLYGLDGDMVQRELHMSVVNMGLCFAFGIPYFLEEIKGNIHSGDIVVLSPEYSLFGLVQEQHLMVNSLLDAYPEAAGWLFGSSLRSVPRLQDLFWELRKLGLKKPWYVISHLHKICQGQCRWQLGPENPWGKVFSAQNMDSHGDFLWHLDKPSCRVITGSLHTPPALDPEAVRVINEFDLFCRQRHASFLIIPPPVPSALFQSEQSLADRLYAQANRELSAPILASPERYVFASNMIQNEQYHLNKLGRPLRTQRVIEDLQNYLTKKRGNGADLPANRCREIMNIP